MYRKKRMKMRATAEDIARSTVTGVIERTSQIQVEVDKYESLTSRLGASLEELDKRLSPVLLTPVPTTVSESQDGVEKSAIASRLSQNSITIEDQIDRLNALIGRIDL